jgi:hypothetical protein
MFFPRIENPSDDVLFPKTGMKHSIATRIERF